MEVKGKSLKHLQTTAALERTVIHTKECNNRVKKRKHGRVLHQTMVKRSKHQGSGIGVGHLPTLILSIHRYGPIVSQVIVRRGNLVDHL